MWYQFEEIAWGVVGEALKEAPMMFQIWASKQVTDIAGVNHNLAKYREKQSNKCPSCGKAIETCAHVLNCKEEGRVRNLGNSLQLVDR